MLENEIADFLMAVGESNIVSRHSRLDGTNRTMQICVCNINAIMIIVANKNHYIQVFM